MVVVSASGTSSADHGDTRDRDVRETRAALSLGFLMGAFLVCWMPFFIWMPLVTVMVRIRDIDYSTGCPKKMLLLSSFEFMTLGGVFTGVKNNSKNFGNKKSRELFCKILSKWTLF